MRKNITPVERTSFLTFPPSHIPYISCVCAHTHVLFGFAYDAQADDGEDIQEMLQSNINYSYARVAL